MKRWLVKITVLLVLGAIVNVAAAWGTLLADNPNRYHGGRRSSGGVLEVEGNHQHWKVGTITRRGNLFIASSWADPDLSVLLFGPWHKGPPDGLIPEWGLFVLPSNAGPSEGHWHYRWLDARGWPMLALWSGVACDTTMREAFPELRISYAIALDSPTLDQMRSTATQQFLPLRPIWPGFVINTLFYAGILWLLFAAPGRIRRWRRIKRGLCPACVYPVGASDVCTECGEKLMRERMGLPPSATSAGSTDPSTWSAET